MSGKHVQHTFELVLPSWPHDSRTRVIRDGEDITDQIIYVNVNGGVELATAVTLTFINHDVKVYAETGEPR